MKGRLGRATIQTTMSATRIRNFVRLLISNGGIAVTGVVARDRPGAVRFRRAHFGALAASLDGESRH
jgi:hypothetical protein